MENVIKGSLETAGIKPDEIGHIHAHGLSSPKCDQEEAAAISGLLNGTPVTAAKSYMGNLGAGSGIVEIMASLMAMEKGELFPTLNHDTPDPACDINLVTEGGTSAGETCLNLNITPQGQASSLMLRKF